MPLPTKLPTSLSVEKADVLANRYFIQTTLGSGNCGTALLVLDRKDKDSKEKQLVCFVCYLIARNISKCCHFKCCASIHCSS